MIVDNPSWPKQHHLLHWGDKDSVVGTRIEQYYNDFKHVRIVPHSVLIDRMDHVCEKITGLAVTKHFQETTTPDYEAFLNNPDSESLEYSYRRFIKMNWLVKNILNYGCKEPLNAVVVPNFRMRGDGKFKCSVHPGIFRYDALGLCDLDTPCVVFDAYEVFPEYPKTTLTEILDLYQDDVGSIFEITMLRNPNTLLTPQIVNKKSDAIATNMAKNVGDWEKRVRHMFDKDINIFIGYDSRHSDATNVCHNTIRRKLPEKISNRIKIHHLDVSKIEGWSREYKDQSTEFTYTRFLVPHLSNYEGVSIFCDDDFIFTENILNLLYFIGPDDAVSCVKHDFKHKYDKKFTNTKDVWYDKKLWSSLMVFNNSHPDCKKLTLEMVQQQSGKYLHQFEWTENIGSIPNKWNWCEGYSDLKDIHRSYGLHFTRGGPWIQDMDCGDIDGLEVYDAYRLIDHIGPNNNYTYKNDMISILDMNEYYDLKNPAGEHADGTLFCKAK